MWMNCRFLRALQLVLFLDSFFWHLRLYLNLGLALSHWSYFFYRLNLLYLLYLYYLFDLFYLCSLSGSLCCFRCSRFLILDRSLLLLTWVDYSAVGFASCRHALSLGIDGGFLSLSFFRCGANLTTTWLLGDRTEAWVGFSSVICAFVVWLVMTWVGLRCNGLLFEVTDYTLIVPHFISQILDLLIFRLDTGF